MWKHSRRFVRSRRRNKHPARRLFRALTSRNGALLLKRPHAFLQLVVFTSETLDASVQGPNWRERDAARVDVEYRAIVVTEPELSGEVLRGTPTTGLHVALNRPDGVATVIAWSSLDPEFPFVKGTRDVTLPMPFTARDRCSCARLGG